MNNEIEYYVSGTGSQSINDTIQPTKPEFAFDQIDKNYDWCSDCGQYPDEHPYIVFSIKDKFIHFNGYMIRAGCCADKGCCCRYKGFHCCECCIYSWSLQISDNKRKWKTIHQVKKDNELVYCKEKIYKFSETYVTKYIRMIQDENCPGDPPCMGLNKIEFFGKYVRDPIRMYEISLEELEDKDEDEVSIIGRVHN
ncbi:hypothetical protein TVAG_146610 [Trichomonas vaginalis G3]|uniref:Uncharacterized protein n=1 Tax=Trichomonas vaginalis (strain ATCC PRA-98 / G3) TaxID=412133 RepID=A2DKW5_TRIV3|nr:galactose-binding domain-like family [Trichomonas vaginalis G3]EAY18918.1 hypothetical protein TVAG_146610 [Trichomonas vaginalis G3]KAI5531979.1 galactose-binding domain-like family [Trichomonas vaginalis G3]|eukprot:XP_001579904.1 hypothetical protein [Trichomonas vaginalis G3]